MWGPTTLFLRVKFARKWRKCEKLNTLSSTSMSFGSLLNTLEVRYMEIAQNASLFSLQVLDSLEQSWKIEILLGNLSKSIGNMANNYHSCLSQWFTTSRCTDSFNKITREKRPLKSVLSNWEIHFYSSTWNDLRCLPFKKGSEQFWISDQTSCHFWFHDISHPNQQFT